MKRLIDIISATILLVILCPLFIIIAILIKLETGNGVFFKQPRVGKKGVKFNIYKFRSMHINAEKTGPYFTTENDARITKIGKILRKTSVDELPQLLNVLKGDMSLIGPRPNVEQQKSLYTAEDWELRNSVRPGITGLAQVTFRSNATPVQRDALDQYYIINQTIFLDLKILLLTFKHLFSMSGN